MDPATLMLPSEDRTEKHVQTSPAERAYGVCIAVMVPVFLVAVWVGGSVKSGVINTALMKNEALYCLAYVGTIFIAFWVGNALPQRFTLPIRGDFARALVRLGVPFFVLTSLFHRLYPTSIRFSEHVGFNLLFAAFVSWAWVPRSTEVIDESRHEQ